VSAALERLDVTKIPFLAFWLEVMLLCLLVSGVLVAPARVHGMLRIRW
jgi:hypothetical protein